MSQATFLTGVKLPHIGSCQYCQMRFSAAFAAACLRAFFLRLTRIIGVSLTAAFVLLQSTLLTLSLGAMGAASAAVSDDPEYCRGAGIGSGSTSHSQECQLCPICQGMRLGAGAAPLPSRMAELAGPSIHRLRRPANDNGRVSQDWRIHAALARGPPITAEAGRLRP